MSFDLSGAGHHIYFNNNGYCAIHDILKANGYDGDYPGTNDGATLTPQQADAIGRAALKFYVDNFRDPKTGNGREFKFIETAVLGYALMLVLSEGQTTHY